MHDNLHEWAQCACACTFYCVNEHFVCLCFGTFYCMNEHCGACALHILLYAWAPSVPVLRHILSTMTPYLAWPAHQNSAALLWLWTCNIAWPTLSVTGSATITNTCTSVSTWGTYMGPTWGTWCNCASLPTGCMASFGPCGNDLLGGCVPWLYPVCWMCHLVNQAPNQNWWQTSD